MNIRVTSQTQTASAIAYMQQRAADLAKYQDQVSSGLRVKRPSDDPGAFVALSQATAASARLGTYSQNVSDATAVLNAGVSALQGVNNLLVQARQISQQGADATANTDPNSVAALASQADGLIEQALQIANSRPDGKSLFGGTATSTTPFRVATADAQGRPLTVAYDGAGQAARTLTGPNQTTDTRSVGSSLFQQPGADLFQSLISLRDQLRDTTLTGPDRAAAFQQRLNDLDSARNAVNDATAVQSSSLATLQSVQNLTGDLKLTADGRIGDLSGTDYAQAVVKMQEQATALQAIYATTVQILQPGLLDFIK